MPRTSFFSKPPTYETLKPFPGFLSKQGTKPTFVDVGGHGDCGFRAIAAGIINKILFENEDSPELRAVLERHFEYFPKHKQELRRNPQGRYSIPLHLMPELVQTMSYTIRQMAVDKIVEEPEHYRGAYLGSNEAMPVSPAQMRLESTWIDETAIAAAAKAIKLPIEVKVVTPEKPLPLRLQYAGSDSKSTTPIKPIVMQLKNKHYTPKVKDPVYFQTAKSMPVAKIMPQEVEKKKEPEMAEILARIEAEDARIEAKFKETKKRLAAAAAAGEAGKDLLLDIWVDQRDYSDYMRGFSGYVGTQHGAQNFFNALDRHDLQAVHAEVKSHKQQITDELVHAIARAITIGDLDENAVFDKIEQQQSKTFGPK
ncbi:Predicted cysteine protease (OTU family) [Legionella lansingensis]|uniref:Uncharacterized protein n=1 Tax=Legionella lansingensis TaxID=45067 RepID=A0A0W0VRD5_9GAMM|nr:hypothetical protein [Legionella lansingensis]KTD22747.1 hypothetical protein Llan_1098 [Legionella lansingensis]SNV56824.1 Predicted cysteine protease (OTU family) [Legionella lansingensis]